MKISILTVGKIKEKYLSDAISEYSKRLGRYCKLEIIQVQDEKETERSSDAQKKQIIEKEADRLLPFINDDSYIIALAIDGRSLTSEGFAEKINSLGINGKSHITFIIGGSLGLSPRLLAKSDYRLSFSAMTILFQLMHVIILEQLYRGFRYIHHEPYHK